MLRTWLVQPLHERALLPVAERAVERFRLIVYPDEPPEQFGCKGHFSPLWRINLDIGAETATELHISCFAYQAFLCQITAMASLIDSGDGSPAP